MKGVSGERRPPTVVVGLCAHGLAITRALARQGVEVHAVEAKRRLPGTRTRYARVHWVEDINDERLIGGLLALHAELGGGGRPVLFPTNDNVVRTLASHGESLAEHYRLSWGHCRETIAALLDKAALKKRCEEIGGLYPRTRLLGGLEEIDAHAPGLEYPLVVKPARPLSSFKMKLVESAGALRELVQRHETQLPFLLQQWIPGGDPQLRFCALYLDRGRILARYEGRKLRSMPPARGGTTVAESLADDLVFAETRRFFDGLDVSGPVSLELKVGPDGRFWIIEPTLGRTDYWLDCCVVNGVNLPHLEYCHQVGAALPGVRQTRAGIWMDIERDPSALVHNLRDLVRASLRGQRLAFPYLAADDIRPSLASWPVLIRNLWIRVGRRIARLLSPRGPADRRTTAPGLP